MIKELIVFGFIAGSGPWTTGFYGPFKTLDDCNRGRLSQIENRSFFNNWFNKWEVRECKKYRKVNKTIETYEEVK